MILQQALLLGGLAIGRLHGWMQLFPKFQDVSCSRTKFDSVSGCRLYHLDTLELDGHLESSQSRAQRSIDD